MGSHERGGRKRGMAYLGDATGWLLDALPPTGMDRGRELGILPQSVKSYSDSEHYCDRSDMANARIPRHAPRHGPSHALLRHGPFLAVCDAQP